MMLIRRAALRGVMRKTSARLGLALVLSWVPGASPVRAQGAPGATGCGTCPVLLDGSLANTPVDDLPEWLQGNRGSIAVVEEGGRRYLRLLDSPEFELLLGDTLPARFELEFTAVHPSGTGIPLQVSLVLEGDRPGLLGFTRRSRHATAVFGSRATGIDAAERQSMRSRPDSTAAQPTRYRLSVDERGARVFVNDSLYANLRGITMGRSDRVRFVVPTDAQTASLIGDVVVRGVGGAVAGGTTAASPSAEHGSGVAPAPAPAPAPMPTPVSTPTSAPSGAPQTVEGGVEVRPIAREPLMETGAAPTGVTVQAMGATAARLSWTAASGATGYVIYRAPSASGPWTSVTPQPVTTTQFTDTGLAPALAAHYVVEAQHQGKASGQAPPVAVQTPAAQPTGFTATEVGPGEVQLTWQPAPGTPRYWVATAGAGSGYVPAPPHTLTGVAPGTYTYTLIAEYQVSGFPPHQLDPASAPSATVTVKRTSGRYRVTINGFRVDRELPDGVLHTDGKGNEIYVATHISTWENGVWRQQGVAKTAVYGDVNGFPARVKAGTLSSDGGLRTGDSYPGAPWQRSSPPQAERFPHLVWEGELEQGNSLVIVTPTVWEWSGQPVYFQYWADQMERKLIMASQRGEQRRWYDFLINAGTLVSTVGPATGGDAVINILDGLTVGVDEQLAVISRDKPIGGTSMASAPHFIPQSVVLTFNSVEAALAQTSSIGGMPPGTVAVEYRSDEGTSGAAYTVFLQVERID